LPPLLLQLQLLLLLQLQVPTTLCLAHPTPCAAARSALLALCLARLALAKGKPAAAELAGAETARLSDALGAEAVPMVEEAVSVVEEAQAAVPVVTATGAAMAQAAAWAQQQVGAAQVGGVGRGAELLQNWCVQCGRCLRRGWMCCQADVSVDEGSAVTVVGMQHCFFTAIEMTSSGCCAC
jgi:hypothetical protein